MELSEAEHRQRQADREARPALGIQVRPNSRLDGDGVLGTDATTTYVTLAITVTNEGEKAAGRTQIDVWVPVFVADTTLYWVDPSGVHQTEWGRGARDPTTRLESGDGRYFDTHRLTRSLDTVPRIGETIYLHLPGHVQVGAESMIPVRVRARTDGSEADETYPLRLRHGS